MQKNGCKISWKLCTPSLNFNPVSSFHFPLPPGICCYIKVDGNASFGLKGESLSSTSNVSLLKIVTKTHGKILTGKCLHLGIDDCRQDVGTTVRKFVGIFLFAFVVRDVFYNQPVRRKQMHSNEDDLLCTRVSPPPLTLLSSGFGIHLSSLIKLNASDGLFKLSGYISEIASVSKLEFPFGEIILFHQVSVAIGIGTCYIKVDDNVVLSFGIWCLTRWTGAADGRKIWREDLSSISDVYLLELLPKLMRGQMDIDGKCFCTLELMSVDKMIVQHVIMYNPT
ncbi:hypothetical protein MTR67_010044 [Solanum verrucosum]|uniref:Uncharacterized protein n=1 Tax=Solanum verrucosum TaxID=315347 RepID=A0AAF0TFD6_SOLVR|nr:hypothetical protein MTR67_010044 [Solanum verrucosum]